MAWTTRRTLTRSSPATGSITILRASVMLAYTREALKGWSKRTWLGQIPATHWSHTVRIGEDPPFRPMKMTGCPCCFDFSDWKHSAGCKACCWWIKSEMYSVCSATLKRSMLQHSNHAFNTTTLLQYSSYWLLLCRLSTNPSLHSISWTPKMVGGRCRTSGRLGA